MVATTIGEADMEKKNQQSVNETGNPVFNAKSRAALQQQEDIELNRIADARNGQQVIKVKLDEI